MFFQNKNKCLTYIFIFSFLISTFAFTEPDIKIEKNLKNFSLSPKNTVPVKASTNKTSADKSMITIDAKTRAEDYQKAYLLIRKDKPSSRIFFKLADGTILSNIVDITVLENGTLLLFKTTTTQGLKYNVIPVEEIIALGHL